MHPAAIPGDKLANKAAKVFKAFRPTAGGVLPQYDKGCTAKRRRAGHAEQHAQVMLRGGRDYAVETAPVIDTGRLFDIGPTRLLFDPASTRSARTSPKVS